MGVLCQKGARHLRRDLVFWYDRPLNDVFAAFVQAANQQFGKNCKIDQGKTISFALNYSFKYNMNGGSLTAHFMPYQNGTAIDLRYTVVQLFGARYKRHAEDLTGFVNSLLQTQGSAVTLALQPFLDYAAQTPSAGPIQVQSEQSPYIPPQSPAACVCPQCGASITPNAKFCPKCGAKQG